jgi:predicted aconitase with swiveling domain
MPDASAAGVEVAEVLVPGPAAGPLLRLVEPVSFWGGVDPETGVIVDRHHRQAGVTLAGAALLTGPTRGSSSSASTLLECVRRGTAPAVLLLLDRDTILAVGAAAAREIYRRGPAVLLLTRPPALADGRRIQVAADGSVTVWKDG